MRINVPMFSKPIPDVPTPADIERMAGEANLSMAEVFRRSGVHHSLFQRWRRTERATTHTVERLLQVFRDIEQNEAAA